MTKYYKLSLSPTPSGVMDSSGTNVLSKSSFKGGNVELVWELADTHIANQFYNITEAAIADEYRWLHWNLYDANQSVNMQLLINTLNTDIDTQGADPLLKLSITDSMKEMNDKLNEVHFIFEKQLLEITSNPDIDHTFTEESNPAVEILERLNKTVHEIEANLSRFFAVEKLHEKQYFLVTRHFSPNAEVQYMDLTDDDYAQFRAQYYTGDLFLDFFTIGKDLSHAYSTKDLELIKRGEVKPQTLITGSACIGLLSDQFQVFDPEVETDLYRKIGQWCDISEVSKYGIDYTEPKHAIGRAKLGTLQNETFETIITKLEACPYVCDIAVWEE